MKLKFFPNTQFFDPDKSEPKDEIGDVGKEIRILSKRRPDLYLRVKSFLKSLKKIVDISVYIRSKQIYKFPKEYDGLYEMRIPKQAQGGVFRIYFCISEMDFQMLMLLCAELKHKTESMKLDLAFSKMKFYKELVKQGIMQ